MSVDSKIAGVGGVLSGIAAVLGTSCCAVPLALSIAGMGSGALSFLEPLRSAQPYLLAIAALALAWGWFTVFWRGVRSRLVIALLAAGTLVLIAALTSSYWDQPLSNMLFRSMAE